ncbi:ABC transporter permease [Alloalcanivorax sp. C16-2]|uniref:ABC transporter permease n=1 Tax=Alloalcanivorax TaxID=3020832 RepID=UPI0019325BDE|nr:ABC transporter permease [Alloalcanivorax marinus]MBL7249213.1 ABC transporter permease [Alloalcanivorax marinus]
MNRGALYKILPPLIAFMGLLVLWQLCVQGFAIPEYVLPSPGRIAVSIADNWLSLLRHTGVTFVESMLGFGLGIVVGLPLAILIAGSAALERVIYPLLVASQSVPKVALAPIFVVWFGFGLMPKVLIAFSIAFFPVVVNTVAGLQRTPGDMVRMMRSLGSSSLEIFWRVRIPMASPYIFAGIKISSAFAVVGAIVGEFIAATSGLGYLQLIANNNLQIPLLFACLVMLSLLGAVIYYLVVLVEHLVLPAPLRAIAEKEIHQ